MRAALLALLTAQVQVAAAVAFFDGPFRLADGLTFYVVNATGTAFDLRIRWTDPGRRNYPRPTLVRVFDPEEQQLLRHEFADDDRVWRLSASGADYRLDFKGLPIILCPDAETARAIRASIPSVLQ